MTESETPARRPRLHAASPESRETVLLLGNYRAAITCARELARVGFRVVVGDDDAEEGGAEVSRDCAAVWPHPPAAEADAFERALRDFLLAHPEVSIVLPVTERYVRLLAERHASLPPGPAYATPAPETVLSLLDKDRSLELARSAGVPVALHRSVERLDELHAAAGEIGFPLIVRPFDSTRRLGDKKAVICGDRGELDREFPVWPADQPSLLVQRQVQGRRHNVYFAASAGRTLRLLEAVILRTDRADGTGLAVEGETVRLSPDLAAHTRALIGKLDYHGVGCAQYLIDAATGSVHFLEINPRIAGHHAVAERAGLELTRLAVLLARSPDLGEPFREGRAGIRYVWSYGELRGLATRWRAGEIGPSALAAALARLFSAALAADMHVTWSWRDPLPTFSTYVKGLRNGTARFGAGGRPARAIARPGVAAPSSADAVSPSRIEGGGSDRKSVLLLGNYRATIACARELARAGYRVVVGCGGDEEGGAEHSRAASASWQHSPVAKADLFRRDLLAFLADHREIGFVFPVSEPYVRFVAENFPSLPKDRVYAIPPVEVVRTCLDKVCCYVVAEEAGLPVAPYVCVDSLAALYESGRAIGFPLVVRPINSIALLSDRRAIICADHAALAASLPNWPNAHSSLLVQKKAFGDRHNVYFAAAEGRLLGVSQSVVRRNERADPTGVSVGGEVVPLRPDVLALTEALVGRLGYHGIGNAQFLVDDESGAVHFLELNPRASANHAVPERAGLRLSRLALSLAEGGSAPDGFHAGRAGFRYAWSYGELRGLRAEWVEGRIGLAAFCLGVVRLSWWAARAEVHLTWSWRDPWPTIMTFARLLPGARRLIGRRPAAKAHSRQHGEMPG